VGEVERLRRLTQDLTDLAAERPLAREPTAVDELVADAARATEAAFPGIEVRRQVDVPGSVSVDPARMRQVLSNLLSNAAQAQGQGEILVRAERRGGAVRILVHDRGPGIPEGASGRVFDLYFTTKSGGTGLGLAVARRLVEQHGGTLVHRRDLRPGTAFEISLPERAAGRPE
jgi:two-component system, OmpR family, sensor kinase